MCFASEEIIEVLNRIKPPYNVNQLTQDVALDRIRQGGTLKEQLSKIIQQRQLLIEGLSNSELVKKVWSSDANFLLVEVDDADKRYKELIEEGIVVRNRSSLPGCSNCLRFTVGTAVENAQLIQALNRLK